EGKTINSAEWEQPSSSARKARAQSANRSPGGTKINRSGKARPHRIKVELKQTTGRQPFRETAADVHLDRRADPHSLRDSERGGGLSTTGPRFGTMPRNLVSTSWSRYFGQVLSRYSNRPTKAQAIPAIIMARFGMLLPSCWT